MRIGKRLEDFLKDILERIKGPSIKKICEKIVRPIFFIRALRWIETIGISYVFWDSLYVKELLRSFKTWDTSKEVSVTPHDPRNPYFNILIINIYI